MEELLPPNSWTSWDCSQFKTVEDLGNSEQKIKRLREKKCDSPIQAWTLTASWVLRIMTFFLLL